MKKKQALKVQKNPSQNGPEKTAFFRFRRLKEIPDV